VWISTAAIIAGASCSSVNEAAAINNGYKAAEAQLDRGYLYVIDARDESRMELSPVTDMWFELPSCEVASPDCAADVELKTCISERYATATDLTGRMAPGVGRFLPYVVRCVDAQSDHVFVVPVIKKGKDTVFAWTLGFNRRMVEELIRIGDAA